MAEMARSFHDSGMQSFRLKLGRSIGEDVRIVSRSREVLGDEVRLRVDYNQAYSPAEAVHAIRAIEPFGIDFAEQPIRATDYVGMAHVQAKVDTPLMAHEGCFSLQDIVTLVELGAVQVVGVNSERPGGVTNARLANVLYQPRTDLARVPLVDGGLILYHDDTNANGIIDQVPQEKALLERKRCRPLSRSDGI